MIQEDKELLMKDLCARLPYGIFVKENREYLDNIPTIYTDDSPTIYTFDYHPCIDNCKPYLRPMSSMTEEEYNKYELTFDNVVVYSGHNNNIHSEHRPTYETFDYLDSIHVDYRGLIEKGLALEAPKDMYKNT